LNGGTAALWPNNEVPYVLDEADFTFKEREIIAEVTCFKMQFLRYSSLQTRLDLYNSELALASSTVLF
jgi:hypothetical protein